MSATKKRTKKYRPKPAGSQLLKTQLWKVKAVFDPLEAIIDQLEQQGTVDCTTGGTPIFKDTNDGHWYETPIAIMGVVDAYQMHQERKGIDLDLEPLRKLAKKLEYDMPIFEADTKACRECFVRMKRETLTMTADYARQMIVDFQIKEELQKAAVI
ncbi:Hypothetical protein HEAR2288 [Herminiimonas arsenicoxydans]|uniref:Uncharacterized protein n=1 Tax=Herminiimonas arsenicoxydans TaxID=204773 RepID=A4G7D3_HERAR|nr:Hypothetical protein HEAR2288 [Herminiimonas arsenicoxydans]